MTEKESKEGDDEHGGRSMSSTIAGAIVLAVVVALGIWLVNELYDSERYAKCVAARHRNCDQIDYRSAPPAPQQ